MNTVLRIATLIAFCLMVSSLALSQQQTTPPTDPKAAPAQSSTPKTKTALAFGLVEDTPVRIKIARTMTSKDARVDERVDFEVLEGVKVGELVVIPRGSMAIATVTEAHPKRRMGRSGRLKMNIDYVRLTSGDKVQLRAV